MSRTRSLLLAGACLLLAACPARSRHAGLADQAEARALTPPPPGSALLYVARASDGAVGFGNAVAVDGVLQGFLGGGEFFRLVLTPGEHRVELYGGPALTEEDLASSVPQSAFLIVRAGEVYFTSPTSGSRQLLLTLDEGGPAADELKEVVRSGTLLERDGRALAVRGIAAAGTGTGGLVAKTPAPPVSPLPELPATPSPRGTPAAGFAAGAPQPTAYALVIGVEKYRDLPPPTGARGDAQQFAQLASRTLGVPERNVILALDDRATKSDLEKHLAWLEKNVPAGGRIYLFFAGHGAPEPASGTSYLLPYDADPAALPNTALKLSDVTARLGKTKARDVVAFLDSCFSGTGGRSVIAAGTRPLVPVQNLAAAPKVSLLAAVTGAQTSGAFSAGGGLFSHYLFEALGSGKADLDGDGQITLREVNDWIAPRVEREAKRDSRDQLPSLTPGAGVDPAQAVLAIGVTGG